MDDIFFCPTDWFRKVSLKPAIKLRRHREDYEFKEILGL